MSKLKKTKSKKKYNKIDTLVPVGILALTFLFIIGGFINNVSSFNTKKESDESNKTTNEFNVEYSLTDVVFNAITTTDTEYENLRNNCNEYISSDNTSVIIGTPDIQTEGTYVDSEENEYGLSVAQAENKDDTLHETGPIYFEDKLLMRYMNEMGEMKIAASKMTMPEALLFKGNKSNKDRQVGNLLENLGNLEVIEANPDLSLLNKGENGESSQYKIPSLGEPIYDTYGIDELDNIFTYSYTGDEMLELSPTVFESLNKNTIVVTEQQYLKDISDIFVEIMQKSSDEISDTLRMKALRYFTDDGYTNIIDNAKSLDIHNSDISVVFIEAGKSDMLLQTKDRLVMQLEVKYYNKTVYTNIIVKLNSDNKVFDIDII